MRPEAELVLLLCRIPIRVESTRLIRALLKRSLEWEAVFSIAQAWEVEPVVFMNLRSLGGEALSGEIHRQLAIREQASRALALGATLRALELIRQVESPVRRVLLLKGPALAVAGYGDPSLRTSADIDLLVRRADLASAGDKLVAIGYKRDYPLIDERMLIKNQHALEFSRPGSKVELHWTLLSRHLHLNIDVDELWTSKQAIELGGVTIEAIAAQHLFFYICAHGAKHEWARLRWICDIAQFGERLSHGEVESVLTLATRLHAKRLVLLALVLARDIAGADISRFDIGSLGEEKHVQAAVSHVRQGLGLEAQSFVGVSRIVRDERLRTLLFWARARERLRDRAASFTIMLLSSQQQKALRWSRH